MDVLLTLAIELIFGLVFLAALIAYLRRRDPITRDVMLIFSAMATLFVLDVVERTVGELRPEVGQIAGAFVLAQPVLTLRLAEHLGPMPRWTVPIAFLAYLATVVPFLLLSARVAGVPDPLAGPRLAVTLSIVAVFVVTELAAAFFLARAALRRSGSARARLGIAALATAAFAVAILGAGAAAASTEAAATTQTISRIMALLSAIGYAVAFVPPRPLRRMWQASTVYWATQDLLRLPPTTPIADLWRWLAQTALRFSGTGAVIVLGTGPRGEVVELAGAGVEPAPARTYRASDLDRLLRASESHVQARPTPDDTLARALVDRARGRFYTAVPLATSAPERAALVLIDRHHSLFGSDDREVVDGIGARTALVIEGRVMLGEQERLSAELAATVQALRTASEAKSDFLASMSHELRTPLSAIIGFSELMRGEPGDSQNVTVPREWIEHIHRGGNHLLGLINDVLDLTKVEAGRLELDPEPLDLRSAVAESIAGLRPLADRKSISISTDIGAETLVADRGRVRQILYNLLSNAIKYTPAGGSVRVSAATTSGRLSLSVADTGVGISASDQGHVFEEFRQVGDPRGREAGTGLGLALTRRLVEAHGGTIELESEPGRGSRFTVHFPTDVAVEAPPMAPTRAEDRVSVGPGPAGGTDVLIIEDDPAAVRLLRTYLETAGYAVRVASDGEEGLREAERAMPAAIVLDVLLPGIDGWEVLRQLKGDERLRDVPVLIVTVVDEREIGLALGAVDYFVKPVDRDALLGRLARYTFMTKVKERTVRILAVDDEPGALDLIGTTLRQEGFEVMSAPDGATALDLARADTFDLVICDLLMPDPDGFAVVAALKAEVRTRDIPVLILTAHELTEAEKALLNGNILGVVGKGDMAERGLRDWLRSVAPAPEAAGQVGS